MTKEEKFLNECKNSGKFNDWQMWGINYGFKRGFTIEQVKLYANPNYSWDMVYQIQKLISLDYTVEEIKKIIDKDQLEFFASLVG